MRPGPRPEATALTVLRGNPAKKKLPTREATPPVKMPTCPKNIRGAARTEWRRLGRWLLAQGLLTDGDRGTLGMYCLAYGRWMRATLRLQELEGAGVAVGDEDYREIRNADRAMNKAFDQMRQMIGELGLSPSARTRVSVVNQPRERTRADALAGKRRGK